MFESFLAPSDKDAVFVHHDLVNDESKIRLAKLRIAVARAFTDESRELIEDVVSNGSVWLTELLFEAPDFDSDGPEARVEPFPCATGTSAWAAELARKGNGAE